MSYEKYQEFLRDEAFRERLKIELKKMLDKVDSNNVDRLVKRHLPRLIFAIKEEIGIIYRVMK